MTSIGERLRGGGPPLAGFLNLIPSPVATQALAAAGADVVVIDQEHGPIGPESLHAMIASTAGTSCSPWVRVSRSDEALVKTALDAGAEGIVFPLVSTAESAAECVALTRYPPDGRRGWGPLVAHSRWGSQGWCPTRRGRSHGSPDTGVPGEGIPPPLARLRCAGAQAVRAPDGAVEIRLTASQWPTTSSGDVEVDAGWRVEDEPGVLGVDAVGAGVVDEEGQAVGGEPDVAAFAALA